MFLQNLVHAALLFRKDLAFRGVAVLTLMTGIGASTAMHSAVYAVISRRLLYNRRNQIVGIGVNASGPHMNFADPSPLTERLA